MIAAVVWSLPYAPKMDVLELQAAEFEVSVADWSALEQHGRLTPLTGSKE